LNKKNSHTNFLKRKFYLLLLLLVCSSKFSLAQETKVYGKVVDAATLEPLPFVNIIFKSINVVAATDFEGKYSISTTQKADSLIFSFIGYNKITRAVKKGVSQEMNVAMTQGIALAEIEVKPGENPAHRVLRKIIANKDNNDRKKLDAYEYEVYNKIEFDLNNVGEDLKKSKLLKPFAFVFDNIDSSNVQEKPCLPVFMTESMSDFYYRRSPKVKNEIIKASKVTGLENNSVSQFMGDMYQNVNIYDNTILVFGKSFVSPISDNALLFYKFYLIDSMVIDGHKCYQLQFKPKRKQELTFTGNLWAADTTFGIIQIEMSISDDANINYITSTNVVQKYIFVDSTWMLHKDRLVIDFNPYPIEQKKKEVMGIYGRKTTSYANFVINKPRPDTFYSLKENLKINEDAIKKDDAYWQKHRHDSLSKNEIQIYKMVDTLQSLPIYKTWVDVIQLFVSGYKVTRNFEYGPYYNMISYNTIEGPRLRFGGRTSNQFSKWYELSGYVAYGTRDEKLKYMLGIRTFISKKPRTMMGMYFKNDNEILGQSQNGFTTDNILASFLRVSPLRNLTNVRQLDTYIEREWFPGFSSKLNFVNRKMFPLADFKYDYYKSENEIGIKDFLTTSEFRFQTRFAYDEKFLDGAFTRTSLGTKYPIVQLQYTMGIKDLFFSDFSYHKMVLRLDDRIRINPIGYFDYALQYGKIWGRLPYPLMELHGGNETYVFDIYAYNAMNYYEFVSDEYASASIEHHFDGFFLNRIPLMRKLKWREVAGMKALIGTVNDKNRDVLIFPNHLYALTRGPYMEANIGVENIFKIFRLDGVWRLSYLDNPRVVPFTIKGTFQIIF